MSDMCFVLRKALLRGSYFTFMNLAQVVAGALRCETARDLLD